MKDDLFTCKEVEGGASIKYHLKEKDITKIVVPSMVEGKELLRLKVLNILLLLFQLSSPKELNALNKLPLPITMYLVLL